MSRGPLQDVEKMVLLAPSKAAWGACFAAQPSAFPLGLSARNKNAERQYLGHRGAVMSVALLAAATLAPFAAPARRGWASQGSFGDVPPVCVSRFANTRCDILAMMSARGGGQARGGPVGRGRGPQYGQTSRSKEPDTLSLADFMALSSRLENSGSDVEGREQGAGERTRQGERFEVRSVSATETKPGDWTCGECGINVFASKSECFRCRTPKPAGAAARGESRGQRDVRETRVEKSADFDRRESGVVRQDMSARDMRARDMLASGRGMSQSRCVRGMSTKG